MRKSDIERDRKTERQRLKDRESWTDRQYMQRCTDREKGTD